MDHIAKLEGSNEFFARRALYNCRIKLRCGDVFAARKYHNVAALCLRAGGVSDTTVQHIYALKKIFDVGNNSASIAA